MLYRLGLFGVLCAATPCLALGAGEPPRIEEVEIDDQRLVVTFDQPMLTWRGETDAAGLRLTPHVDCRWFWEEDTRLACVVERGQTPDLRPATAYRLHVGAGLWSQSGGALAPAELTAVSSVPRADASVLDWNAGQPEIVVQSHTAPVSAQDLARVLDLRVDGASLAYVLKPVSSRPASGLWVPDGGSAYTLVPSSWPAAEGTLVLSVREGLRSTAGPVRGEARMLLTVPVNEPLRLARAACGWSDAPSGKSPDAEIRCTADARVTLTFTRRLAPGEDARIAAANGWLTLSEPQALCRWGCDVRGARYNLVFSAKAAGQRLPLVLPDDLRAEDGSVVQVATPRILAFGDRYADVRAEPVLRLLRPGADASLALQVRNLPAPVTVAELTSGRRTRLRDSVMPIAGTTNQYQAWRAPPPRGDMAQRGGLTLAGVRGPDYDGFAVAVAPFNLIAADDGERVLVWATDWDSAAAVAGADIELLEVTNEGRETVLARGRTGADGVGYLPSPKQDIEDEEKQARLVRVRHGGQQTVMPVLVSWSMLQVRSIPGRDWGEGRHYYGASESLRHFGVSDRLLYRPGDQVSFRLWSRQREGNRLRAMPGAAGDTIELLLRKQGDSAALDAWSAPRDAWGSVAGERALSANLADGSYCITRKDDPSGSYSPSGVCFDVARFDSAAVWASSAFDRKLVRPGGELALDIEGGFYSGGGAAGAEVEAFAILAPTRFGEVYPDFARFTFASPLGKGGEASDADPLASLAKVPRLDGRGKARFAGRLPAPLLHGAADDDAREPVAFGEIRVNAAVTIPGAASSSSPVAKVVYAGFDRYVGLRAEGWWLSSSEDPVLETVVATAEGQAVADARVSVRIERDDGDATQVLARCELTPGAVSPCPFRAPEPGEYRFVAESPGAAPASFTRYFYGSGPRDDAGKAPQVELSLVTAPQDGQDAVLRLLQPHARASALFVVEYGTVLRHWVQEVGPDTQVRVPLPPEWAPGVSVRVLLRPSSAAGAALDPTTLNAVVRVPLARVDAGTVTVLMPEGARAPGEELVLTLHNPTQTQRLVTLAIVDDSVHQQAAAQHDLIDPAGPRFLGLLDSWEGAQWFGFADWDDVPNLFLVPHVVNEPMVAAAPPADYAAGESATLDSIEVTGSRIKRADIADSQPATSVPPRDPPSAEGPPAARVRSRFPVTAYWNAGEALAPGETRELRVRLPDNLTRWRLLYWTSDAADGFAVAEQTFQSTLPLEIRAGLPTRLFQGDQGSGTVLARVNAPQGADVTLQVNTEGAGADREFRTTGKVAPQASLAQRIALVPDAAGRVALLARASTDATSDALSSAVEVSSRLASVSVTQAGWLEGGPLSLQRPDLPRGAMSPVLEVTLAQGTDTWRDGWLRDLRQYPHRCWEQTLSRGIGAAIALASPDSAAQWPDAAEVVATTLRDAPSFVDDQGHYRYFAGGDRRYGAFDPVLSAHSLRGYRVLAELGHPVPEAWRETLRDQLETYAARAPEQQTRIYEDERMAIASGALAEDGRTVAGHVVPRLWESRREMSWYGRTALVRAAARDPRHAALAAQGLQELREAGSRRGARRILTDGQDWSMFMGSPLRDQCAITATLFALDSSPGHLGVRQQWLRGLSDLYAGGTGSLDTQASVNCLLALREAGAALDVSTTARADVSAGLQSTELSLAPGERAARWETPLAPTAELAITPQGGSDGTLNYSAQVSYVLDQRDAVPQATGLQLQRSYQVMRGGEWRELGEGAVSEGEWLRTTLTLVAPAMRHFVAITDTVPGGLVTRDVRLGGVAGESLQRLADPGSWWFDTRQTGASEVRFYAEQLPPGTHQLHYYTQATHAGRYFAPPAVAELMYGRNSRANTGPRDLVVRPRP